MKQLGQCRLSARRASSAHVIVIKSGPRWVFERISWLKVTSSLNRWLDCMLIVITMPHLPLNAVFTIFRKWTGLSSVAFGGPIGSVPEAVEEGVGRTTSWFRRPLLPTNSLLLLLTQRSRSLYSERWPSSESCFLLLNPCRCSFLSYGCCAWKPVFTSHTRPALGPQLLEQMQTWESSLCISVYIFLKPNYF